MVIRLTDMAGSLLLIDPERIYVVCEVDGATLVYLGTDELDSWIVKESVEEVYEIIGECDDASQAH